MPQEKANKCTQNRISVARFMMFSRRTTPYTRNSLSCRRRQAARSVCLHLICTSQHSIVLEVTSVKLSEMTESFQIGTAKVLRSVKYAPNLHFLILYFRPSYITWNSHAKHPNVRAISPQKKREDTNVPRPLPAALCFSAWRGGMPKPSKNACHSSARM